MKKIKLCLALYLISTLAYAEVECPIESSDPSVRELSDLNQKIIKDSNCLNWKDAPEGKSPEEKLKKMTTHLSEKEIFTRLILSEAYASGSYSKDLAEGIAWVLKNRVDAKNEKSFGTGVGVVFKAQQFRSSTGNCDVAKRDVFLCPQKINAKHLIEVSNVYDKVFSGKGVNPLPKSYNYFFLKHFDNSKDSCAKWKGIAPNWKKKTIKPGALNIDPSNTLFYIN